MQCVHTFVRQGGASAFLRRAAVPLQRSEGASQTRGMRGKWGARRASRHNAAQASENDGLGILWIHGGSGG